MINICKPNGKPIKLFKSDDAFNHLSAGELLEDHPEIDTTHWGFVVFPPKMVPDLYFKLKQQPVPAPLKEAYEQCKWRSNTAPLSTGAVLLRHLHKSCMQLHLLMVMFLYFYRRNTC